MKIIVPMAGRGSRLRPHSLTTPKPLISVAGAPIVHQLVHEIAKVVEDPITDIGFVIGDPAFFGEEVVISLEQLAEELGAKPHIFRQDQPLGTGHAIMCAEPLLEGPTVVAYADTLIRAKLTLDPDADAVIWVKKVTAPEAFGVVALNAENQIVDLVEKPTDFVSDLAVIGIYYFKQIQDLKVALKKVVSQDLQAGEEYQINHGILAMMEQGAIFKPGAVDTWMDCGNPEVTLQTNAEILEIKQKEGEVLQDPSAEITNSTIVPPCFIGKNVKISDSTVGPGVSIGAGTQIQNCKLQNCLIQNNSSLENLTLQKAMIGNQVRYKGNPTFVSLGDYSQLE
jgi:glucose-1-phosphate thymidylyltransferase